MSKFNDHGFIFTCLQYIAIFLSIFLITFLKPHRYYKRFISAIFNLKFKWNNAVWKVYHVLILFILTLIFILLVLKMQSSLYDVKIKSETYDKKLFRLSQKWLIEAEMWLVFLILVELSSIYKMVIIEDERNTTAETLGLTSEQIKEIENKYD